MTPHTPEPIASTRILELLIENGFDGMAQAIEILFNEAMRLERSRHLDAEHYERTDQRRGFANGFKDKHVKTRAGELALKVPQVRDLAPGVEPFYPSALERGERSERAVKLAVAEMYVQGVSTRKVLEVTRVLCGFDITSSQVSRASKDLDEELRGWRTRDLSDCPHLILDARYEKVRHGGSVRDCAVLIASGVLPDGHRTILGVSVALSEAEVHWRGFLDGLIARGLRGVQSVTSDAHAGLRAALRATLPGVIWQRCQFHLQQNAQAHVPRVSMKHEVATGIRGVFDATDKIEADRRLADLVIKYRETAPALATWLEENLPQGLAVLALPEQKRRRLRTSNGLERVNQELKRRTRVVTLFPNELALLRLVSAVLMETSEEWETGRLYFSPREDRPA